MYGHIACVLILKLKKRVKCRDNAFNAFFHYLCETMRMLLFYILFALLGQQTTFSKTENLKTSKSERRLKSKGKSQQLSNSASQQLSNSSYEKIRFLALTYTRLGRLFYNENYCDLAITKYRKALKYVDIIEDELAKANVLKELGNSYQLSNKADSALYYYNESLRYNSSLPNKLDVDKSIAQILFYKGDKETAYSLIRNNLNNINDINVKYSYYSVLGEFYSNNQVYDSAIYYYEKSTCSNIYYIMLSSYSELSKIYKSTGNYEKESHYNNKISNLLVHKINNEVDKSKILTIYNDYKKLKLDRETKNKQKIIRRTILRLVVTFVCVLFMITFFVHKNNKRQFSDKLKKLQVEIDESKREINVIESELLTKHSEVDVLLKSIKDKEKNLVKLSKQIEEKDNFILGLKFKHSLIDGKIKSKNSELKEKEKLITQYIINELKNKLIRHTSNATSLQLYFQSDICSKMLNQISDLSVGNIDTSLLNPLSREEFILLLKSANYCLNGLMNNISKKYPNFKKEDIYYLCLTIINLNDKQIAALFGVTYHAIRIRRKKICSYLGVDIKENLHRHLIM